MIRTRVFLFSVIVFASLGASCFAPGTKTTTVVQNGNASLKNVNVNVKSNVQTEPSESVDKLLESVTLPIKPTQARWKIIPRGAPDSRVPGPTDFYLLAEIRFAENEIEKLSKQLEPETTETWKIDVFKDLIGDWFSDSAKKQFERISSEEVEIVSYSLKKNIKPPYSTGSLKKIPGSDFYILVMSAM